MHRIDWKKWKADVDAVENGTGGQAQLRKDYAAGKLDWKEYYAQIQAAGGHQTREQELTKLYSIRAGFRKLVHRKAAKLTYDQAQKLGITRANSEVFNAAGGTLKFVLGEDEQDRFVDRAWEQYIDRVWEAKQRDAVEAAFAASSAELGAAAVAAANEEK